MLALLSIKPVHTENIFSGRKTFEYRRKVFARSDVRTVLVYCTKPVGKLVGEFDIDEILQDSPSRLWKQTRKCPESLLFEIVSAFSATETPIDLNGDLVHA
ncbi:putative transcriptional regulator [Bradyrhizobium ottawaense]|uniref:ASCH domain-containing protein n=1 Tax=Bradyrhizobium ottawaense TaxID=931866 RepID=UPI003837E9AB